MMMPGAGPSKVRLPLLSATTPMLGFFQNMEARREGVFAVRRGETAGRVLPSEGQRGRSRAVLQGLLAEEGAGVEAVDRLMEDAKEARHRDGAPLPTMWRNEACVGVQAEPVADSWAIDLV